jgi:hypothetical protein
MVMKFGFTVVEKNICIFRMCQMLQRGGKNLKWNEFNEEACHS